MAVPANMQHLRRNCKGFTETGVSSCLLVLRTPSSTKKYTSRQKIRSIFTQSLLTSLVSHWFEKKNPLAMQEMWETRVQPLEEEMETHSTILAWEIPWTVGPGGLQFMGVTKRRTQLSVIA